MMQNKVIELFKSKSLIAEIKQRHFQFDELQLVRIIYDYAHTYTQRLQLLRELVATAKSAQPRELAERCIAYQEQSMAAFMATQSGAAYEIHIKDDPDAYEERYLCRTYEGALGLFKTFHMSYKCEASEDGMFYIALRKFVDGNSAADFEEDEIGSCWLTKDGDIEKVDIWELDKKNRDADNDDGSCCNKLYINNVDVTYPPFLNEYDPVIYHRCGQGFGIALRVGENDKYEAYVLPLDFYSAKYGDYKNIHDTHMHVELPLVEKIDASTLSEELKIRYDSIVAYLRGSERGASI